MTFKVPKGQSRGGDPDPEVEPGEKSMRKSPVTGTQKEKLVLAVLRQVLRKVKNRGRCHRSTAVSGIFCEASSSELTFFTYVFQTAEVYHY